MNPDASHVAPYNGPALVARPGDAREAGSAVLDRRLPPIAELAVASVACVLSGGVYMGAHLPKSPSLGPVIGLLATGGVLTLIAMAMLARVRRFAWGKFFLVARWAFLAYLVITGMLLLVFLYDHTRGGTLAVMVITLVVFAMDVPMVIAFTVARYEQPESRGAGSDTS